jgi:nucleotide-binding universal stress UspA family protein
MKSIFLHVHVDQAMEHRLIAAVDLARVHGGHVSCVRATPFNSYIVSDPFGGIYTQPSVLEALQERNDAERTRIEQYLAGTGVSFDWVEGDGEAGQVMVDRGRLADILVLSRLDKRRDDGLAPLSIVSDVALHARAPVLVVPPGLAQFRADAAAVVAWNGSIEAAHSLRQSLAFLRRASAVHIVTVNEGRDDYPAADAALYLSRHGISARLVERDQEGRSIATTLVDSVEELGASCLVMGAYGHSRLRETVLGGVTRDLLNESTVPLLLSH